MQKLTIQGIPFDANSSFLQGASFGPSAIFKAFSSPSSNFCTQEGIDLLAHQDRWMEAGNIRLSNESGSEAYDQILQATQLHLEKGLKVISLGGDHSITFPIIAAYSNYYPDLHIVQIDAHGDLYSDFEGNYYSHASPFARILEKKLVTRLTQIGNRTLTNSQRQLAKKYNVSIIEMKDLDIGQLPSFKGPLYISFDLDVLDPAFAPGVSHYEPGGLSTREALKLLEGIQAPIVGADIVELNPNRDLNGMTAMVAGKLLKELVGKMIF